MPSSVIRRFHYRLEERELDIEFVSGRRYVYFGVPPEEVDRFKAAMAKGRYFNAHIRGYACREVPTSHAPPWPH